VVGVSNAGTDRFWTGHPLAQANLYAFGRLAWDPTLSPDVILAEWVGSTFDHDPVVTAVVTDLVGPSAEIYESYVAPLGVGFMVNPGHHYGPNPDGYEYSPWGTYHFADRDGVGVDRTRASGTGFTDQYPPPWRDVYESIGTCPDELLLFFHHVPYAHRLHNGSTVIQHIYDSHFEGVQRVEEMVRRWRQIEGRLPDALYQRVAARLAEQLRSAIDWRDTINTYFFRHSGIPDRHGRPIP
jgi:alpha-glucuronidase